MQVGATSAVAVRSFTQGGFLNGKGGTFFEALRGATERRGVAVMGVCNVTPDSFSDGGLHFSKGDARARVDQLLAEGVDVVDIGGESTRPGAPPVPTEEQLARVRDVIVHAVGRGACVSVDTADPEVAEACLDHGAAAINDVSCLRDPRLAAVCARAGAALVLMHARGTQAEMRGFSKYPDDAYGDVVQDVLAEWNAAAARAVGQGLPREALVMDPGLGFAKNARHSLALLRRLREVVAALDVPVLVGASRKSFLKLADPEAPPEGRFGASLAAALHAADAGATLVRVHDVAATRQALDMRALLAQRSAFGPPVEGGSAPGHAVRASSPTAGAPAPPSRRKDG